MAQQDKTSETDILNKVAEYLDEEQRTEQIAKSRKSAIEALSELRLWLVIEDDKKLPHGLKNGVLAAAERLLGEL